MPKIDFEVLHSLINFVTSMGWKVTSTTGGKHNRGSLHYIGHAVDVSVHNRTEGQIDNLKAVAPQHGFRVIDERVRPPGQKVWGGPHLHVEKPL